MRDHHIHQVLARINKAIAAWPSPVVDQLGKDSDEPFPILIACLLSLRTRDSTTAGACHRLFEVSRDPFSMAKLSLSRIEKAIYPVGFYRTKSKHIKALSKKLVREFEGKVPDTLQALLNLPGVGQKTANLVLGLGFGIPAICVDIHVHRISNRWGYIRTTTPEKSEVALCEKLPKRYWIAFNGLLVPFGQHQCTPRNPKCETCPISEFCSKNI